MRIAVRQHRHLRLENHSLRLRLRPEGGRPATPSGRKRLSCPSLRKFGHPHQSSEFAGRSSVDGVEVSQPFGLGSDASASAVVRKR
jgi:hypothetical protein